MKSNKEIAAQEVQAQEQLKVKIGISNLEEFTGLVSQTIDNLNKIKNFKFGITQSETFDITRSDGTPDIKMNTKWTQKGRLFLYELLRENEVLPDIERAS